MNLIESFVTESPCYKEGRRITVRGLMLHSVGCPQPSAQAFIRQWNSPDYRASCVHAIIDGGTGAVYQLLPWNYRGWHCGGSANNGYIGVEMCEPAGIRYISPTAFTCASPDAARPVAIRTYHAAVELFARLCERYGLDPRSTDSILSHAEGAAKGVASAHADPEHLWKGLGLGYTMDGFRADVWAQMHPSTPAPTQTASARQTQCDNTPAPWAADAVTWAVDTGIMQGDEDGDLMLREPVTREQFVTMLKRYHDLK